MLNSVQGCDQLLELQSMEAISVVIILVISTITVIEHLEPTVAKKEFQKKLAVGKLLKGVFEFVNPTDQYQVF